MHQNIQGLLSKLELLEITLSSIKAHTEPQVICFTETFLKTDDVSNVVLSGYELASTYCRKNRRGGSGILIKKGIPFIKVTNFDDLSLVNVFECCSIVIPHCNIVLCCIYRTPSRKNNHVDAFFQRFDRLMYRYHRKYPKKKIVLAGDMNINVLEKRYATDRLIDILRSYKLELHINEPTRGKSCIDLIISNIKQTTSSILSLWLSDHDTAQFLRLNCKECIQIPRTIYKFKRIYSNENIKKFRDSLNGLTFSTIFAKNDPNLAFNDFHDLVSIFYKLCFPTIKTKINIKSNLKWLTKGLKKSCITKRKLQYIYYKNKSKQSKAQYNKYKKLLKRSIYIAKKQANSKYIKNSKNISKATWRVIDQEIGNIYTPNDITQIKNKDTNQILTNPYLIANKFNEYFINQTNSINNTICNTNNNNLSQSIYLTPVDSNDIKKYIMTLKSTKSEGYDNICTNVIKCCKNEISLVLAHLVNLSLEHGVFPDKLKNSIIKPLYKKKGDKTDMSNYRPIALIPILSKLYEMV